MLGPSSLPIRFARMFARASLLPNRLIREQHVQAVFVEPQYPVTAATQIAKEAGAKIYTLDPVASGDLDNLDAYLEIMEQNRLVLAEALK